MFETAIKWREFEQASQLAAALADEVAARLTASIDEKGSALLAVSGGKTPARFFDELSRRKLDWENVTATLADERCAPGDSSRSNARMVGEKLLVNEAAAARFVGLYDPAPSAESAAGIANARLKDLQWPIDVLVLGMGEDGHTASFFPDAKHLDTLFANARDDIVLPVEAASAEEPRLTLSAQTLASGRFTALHIEGPKKRAVLDAALVDNGNSPLPIRTVVEAAENPVTVYWAP